MTPLIHATLLHTTVQVSLYVIQCINVSSGLYTGFLPRGGKFGVCKKEGGGEAVRSCRAATGGWVQEGDVPPPAQNFFLSEIYLHEL